MATLSLYDEKENFFSTWQYDTFASASASEFYRDLFPVGTFEKRLGKLDDYPKTNLGNGFIVYTTPSERKGLADQSKRASAERCCRGMF